MYSLENNVEWTNALKEAFKHNVTRSKILVGNTEINEGNYLQNLTLDELRYISNYGFIGTATARKLEIYLLDIDKDLNLENEEVILKIGADYNNTTYYINYGNFIVDKAPEVDETNGTVKIIAYDYMIKFNQPYEDRVKYPCSLLTLLQDICSQAGVELGSNDFANKNFVIENNQFEGYTLRQVLQEIGKCAFSWARIGQDNKLYLDFSLTPYATETITIDDYKLNCFKKANEYYGPVNQVTYADSDIQGQEERVKDQESIDENGLKELVIYDNLFAYTPEKRHALIQAGTRLLGLRYMPISQLELIGLAYLDSRDAIEIENLEEETFISRVFNHSIKYNGTLHDSIINEGTSNNEEAYKNTANNIFQDMQTRIALDKANKKIELVVEDVQNNTAVKSSKGNGQVTLSNCKDSYLVKLRIIGNNQVFKSLYISNRLKVASTLYLQGDSLIVVTDKDGNSKEYDLGITEPLRANDEVYDEYILENNHAKVIRRVNADGTTKQAEQIEDLGELGIYLEAGNNILKIKHYYANVEALYIEDNGYTDQLSTKEETRAAIEITKNEIDLEVSKKVNDEDLTGANIILRINGDESEAEVDADKVSLKGKQINLTSDDITINSNNFSVDENGNMSCSNANVTGTINSSNGTIGGCTIDSSGIYSGTGNTTAGVGTYGSRQAFWAGSATNNTNNAPFRVDHLGNMTCTNANVTGTITGSTISGGTISGTSITNGNNFSVDANGNMNCSSATITGGSVTLNGNSGVRLIRVQENNSNSTMAYISPRFFGVNNYSDHIEMYCGEEPSIDVFRENVSGTYITHAGIKTPTVTQTSKESTKKNIEKYVENASEIIKQSEIYTYNFKSEKDEDKKHIGFVIGDEGGSYKTPEEVISNGEGIDTYSMTSILWKAVQEQQEIIEQMQKEIKELKEGK